MIDRDTSSSPDESMHAARNRPTALRSPGPPLVSEFVPPRNPTALFCSSIRRNGRSSLAPWRSRQPGVRAHSTTGSLEDSEHDER